MRTNKEELFWSHVLKTKTCWLWTASVNSRGYGTSMRGQLVHRISYRLIKGEIPGGLEIDHICSNKRCVNPEHLEAVSHLVNMRRIPRKPKQDFLVRRLAFLKTQIRDLNRQAKVISNLIHK